MRAQRARCVPDRLDPRGSSRLLMDRQSRSPQSRNQQRAAAHRHGLLKPIVRVRFPSPAPLKDQVSVHLHVPNDLVSEEPGGYPCHSICLRVGLRSHQLFKLIVRVMGLRRVLWRADQRRRWSAAFVAARSKATGLKSSPAHCRSHSCSLWAGLASASRRSA